MLVAKVIGSTVSTQKLSSMRGFKLLVVEPCGIETKQQEKKLSATGRTLVAVDMLGAGEGEYVLLSQGSSARLTPETKTLPIDTLVVGIIDTVHVEGTCVFDRERPLPARTAKEREGK